MAILKEEELNVLRKLMTMNEAETKNYMANELAKYYKSAIINDKSFILAFGTIPVALVAHMDTVEESHKHNAMVVYDQEQEVMTTIGTYGFDDKLGCFSILRLVQMGYRPNIILTCQEETGGGGAMDLIHAYPTCPFPDLKYLIELDRMGDFNFVTYSNGDPEIIKYIQDNTPYEIDIGSFSDVDVIGPQWKIGFVNLSVGYYLEHTPNEHVFVDEWHDQFQEWRKLLELANDAPAFKYVQSTDPWWHYPMYYPHDDYDDWYYATKGVCDECGTVEHPEEFIQAVDENGNFVELCPECAKKIVSICDLCDTPFIPKDPKDKLCPFCATEVGTEFKKPFVF